MYLPKSAIFTSIYCLLRFCMAFLLFYAPENHTAILNVGQSCPFLPSGGVSLALRNQYHGTATREPACVNEVVVQLQDSLPSMRGAKLYSASGSQHDCEQLQRWQASIGTVVPNLTPHPTKGAGASSRPQSRDVVCHTARPSYLLLCLLGSWLIDLHLWLLTGLLHTSHGSG